MVRGSYGACRPDKADQPFAALQERQRMGLQLRAEADEAAGEEPGPRHGDDDVEP